MSATVIAHEWIDNWNMDVDIVRDVGEARGVHVEVWRSKASGRIALVVSPTIQGFTVLAVGGTDEADTFAKVGGCVLAAMSGVIPLVTGDMFRGGPVVMREPVSAEARQ